MDKSIIGKKIKITWMADEPSYCGRTGIVKIVDDMGQLHGTWGGLAVIPGEDQYELID